MGYPWTQPSWLDHLHSAIIMPNHDDVIFSDFNMGFQSFWWRLQGNKLQSSTWYPAIFGEDVGNISRFWCCSPSCNFCTGESSTKCQESSITHKQGAGENFVSYNTSKFNATLNAQPERTWKAYCSNKTRLQKYSSMAMPTKYSKKARNMLREIKLDKYRRKKSNLLSIRQGRMQPKPKTVMRSLIRPTW